MSRFRSILSRVVALHVVAIGVTSILMPLALYWLLNEAANSLHRETLRGQALGLQRRGKGPVRRSHQRDRAAAAMRQRGQEQAPLVVHTRVLQ